MCTSCCHGEEELEFVQGSVLLDEETWPQLKCAVEVTSFSDASSTLDDAQIADETSIAAPSGAHGAPVGAQSKMRHLRMSGRISSSLSPGSRLMRVDGIEAAAAIRIQSVFRGGKGRAAVAEMHEQGHKCDRQDALGRFKHRFMICKNRPENDAHWDSDDKEWVGRASMSKRHCFLTTRDLNWCWFNALVFGLVDDQGCSVSGASKHWAALALRQVILMQEAALLFCANSRNYEGWSKNIGLFFHIFPYNSVNSLHLHIVDLAAVGPTYHSMVHKNCPIQAILDVLSEEAGKKNQLGTLHSMSSFCLAKTSSIMEGLGDGKESGLGDGKESEAPVRRKKPKGSVRAHSSLSSMKEWLKEKSPCVNDAATFRGVRSLLWDIGGPGVLYCQLDNEGFVTVKHGTGKATLTTSTKPFNVFARMAFGDTKDRLFLDAQKGSTVIYQNYLWKYSKNAEETPEELSDLDNWRRRLFFYRHEPSRRLLSYISEKDSGTFINMAVLSSTCEAPDTDCRGAQARTASVHQLAKVEMLVLCEAIARKASRAFKESKIPIASTPSEKATKTIAIGEETHVPTELHPIAIEWIDDECEKHRIIVATAVPESAEVWMDHLLQSTDLYMESRVRKNSENSDGSSKSASKRSDNFEEREVSM